MSQFMFFAMFYTMIGLYLFAALFSLITYKRHELSNRVSNILCFFASAIGIYISIIFIINHFSSLDILRKSLSMPYVDLFLKIDSISAFFMLVLSLLVSMVSIYSIGYCSQYYTKRPVPLLNFLCSIFILSMVFVLTSGNTIVFFISWEVMALSSYFLVSFESEKRETQNAGTLYIIMTHIGTSFLLIAFVILYINSGSFQMDAVTIQLPEILKNILFVLFLLGFGTKAGVVPLHIWLPHAHPAAPSNISTLMSGFMIKTAIFGIIRFLFEVIGIQHEWWGGILLITGIISTIVGVTYAFVENNIKKLLAYSSIENMGIIFMGLGIAAIGVYNDNMLLYSVALIGAMLHTLNHTLFKGLAFMNAGSIHFASHTLKIDDLGGLMKIMPFTGIFTLVGGLSLSAIIPFNGFIGEWITFQSFFMTVKQGQSLINILAIISVIALAIAGTLSAGIFVKLIGIAFLGLPRSEHAKGAKEVPFTMLLPKGVLALLCLLIGIFPIPIIGLISTAFKKINVIEISGSAEGNSIIPWFLVKINNNGISPAFSLGLGLLVVTLLLVFIKIFLGKTSSRQYNTWDCGFESLNSRMQYSAAGFSNPISIILKSFFKPIEKLIVKRGLTPHHSKRIEYHLVIENVFEKRLYSPFIRFSTRLSRKIKFKIQTGSIHLYLVYIFITIFILLLYNRMV